MNLHLAETFSGMKGCQHEEELGAFIEILKSENVRSYLEIGSRYGDSLHKIGMALPEGSRIVSVELADALWGKPGSRDYLDKVASDLCKSGRETEVIWGDSRSPLVIANVLRLGPFDACLIDGDHTIEGAVSDWINYGPMSKIVAFHDIVARKAHDGRSGRKVDVPWVWDALKRRYQHKELVGPSSPMGIGVLWRA